MKPKGDVRQTRGAEVAKKIAILLEKLLDIQKKSVGLMKKPASPVKKPSSTVKNQKDKSTRKFSVGEEVWLMNPKRSTQKAASGKVSGVGGKHKFHFKEIPEKWFKVDVQEALLPETK